MKKTFFVILVAVLGVFSAQASTVYTKVSGKPVNDWPGTYVIVYEVSESKALVWDGEDNSANYQEVTIADGKITSEDLKDYQITVSKEGSNEYYVKAKEGYIGCTAKKNSIEYSSGGKRCTIKSNGGYVQLETNTNTCRFVYNTNANRFRFYYDKDKKWADSDLKNICFYALGEIEQEEPKNKLDLGYAQADMYACDSKFPTQNNPYDQYFFTYLFLAQEEDENAVPQISLEILAPTQYSLAGTYKSDYTAGQKYFINCQAGSKHSSFIFPNKSEQGWGEASIKLAEMTITKVGTSAFANAYKYHIKLVFTDSNQKIWTLDKDMDVFATWSDCDRSGKENKDMNPVPFVLESGTHTSQETEPEEPTDPEEPTEPEEPTDPEEQGIDEVSSDPVQSAKVIRDGQLIIEHNGKTYNAQGVRL